MNITPSAYLLQFENGGADERRRWVRGDDGGGVRWTKEQDSVEALYDQRRGRVPFGRKRIDADGYLRQSQTRMSEVTIPAVEVDGKTRR